MANWLSALGGVGQGVTLGLQDMREMEKQKFLREQQEFLKQQQEQQRREWADQEDIRQKVSQVRRTTPGYYGQSTNLPIRDDEGNMMPGASETTRPAREVYGDLANVYAGSSNPRLAQMGLQYQTAATQAGEQEFTIEQRNRLKEAQKKNQERIALIRKDPAAAAEQLMAQFNNNQFGGPDADNFFTAGMSTPNGQVISVYNRAQPTRPVMQIPVNPQALEQVARSIYVNDLAGIDPRYIELQLKGDELGIKGFTAQSEAGERAERIRTGNWGALGQNNAQAALFDEQLRTGNWGALGLHQAQAGAAQAGRFGNLTQVGVDEKTGEPVFGYMSRGTDGRPVFETVKLPPGVRTIKPARDIPPEKYKAILTALEGVPQKAADRANYMAGLFSRYGEEDVRAVMGQRGGNDTNVAAALANPPGKEGSAPAKPADKPTDKPAAQQDDAPPANKDYENLSPKAKAAGEALDKARTEVSKATVEGRDKWGSAQRLKDPKGYEKYKERRAEAEAIYEAAKREWFKATGQ